MVQINFDPLTEARAHNFAVTGPSPAIPRTRPADQVSETRPAPNASGWQAERPLQPQPGIDLIDRMCVTADQRERQQAQAPDTMTQMVAACTAMLQMQTQTIALLAQHLLNQPATTTDRKGKTHHERTRKDV